MLHFPDFSDSAAKNKITDLARLMDRTLTNTRYIDGLKASRLLGVILSAYRDAAREGAFGQGVLATQVREELFGLMLAAAFDLVCNIEYIHGRVVNSKWIYCHRDDDSPRVFYSFLKQCPRCCLDRGLESRLSGAQHKPTSHHIGEITTVVTALLLQLIASAHNQPLEIATITKQSHDVDAIGFRDDALLLFEIKASPMVTFPLVAHLDGPLLGDGSEGPAEYQQHALVDMTSMDTPLALAIPHRGYAIPLGTRRSTSWPYDEAIEFFSKPDKFLEYLSAWLELYHAYSIPKTQRTGASIALAYLVNGWGDEIDSNKTKPGLGRTDDIKKGTYQLLKFGAYYRDEASRLKVRGALVTNLDPLFLRADYVDGLIDVRWGRGEDFRLVEGEYRIPEKQLRYLYDGIMAFNQPSLNDPLLRSVFDIEAVERALIDGRLDEFLHVWCSLGPDVVVEEVSQGGLF